MFKLKLGTDNSWKSQKGGGDLDKVMTLPTIRYQFHIMKLAITNMMSVSK